MQVAAARFQVPVTGVLAAERLPALQGSGSAVLEVMAEAGALQGLEEKVGTGMPLQSTQAAQAAEPAQQYPVTATSHTLQQEHV